MKNKVSVVLFSRNQYICHNFLFNVCMWNRHTNMELISQIKYNLIMGCIILLINITYCPTWVKNYLNFVEFFVLFETPSYVWSNLFLRTSSWTDGYMSLVPNGSSMHIHDVIYHEILLVLRRQAVLSRLLCFMNFFIPHFHFLIFSWEFQIILCYWHHQKLYCEFSKSWTTKVDLSQ